MGLLDRIKLKKILKLQGRNSFSTSMRHALDGIDYTVTHERNFKIEIFFAIVVSSTIVSVLNSLIISCDACSLLFLSYSAKLPIRHRLVFLLRNL